MKHQPCMSIDLSLGALIATMVDLNGSAAHPYCADALHGDRQAFVRDLVDFADFVHLVALLHGQTPGLVDQAATRTVETVARQWLLQAIDAFVIERQYLTRLSAMAGPLPSTAGHRQSVSIMAQQRHAIEILAQSERRGTALGAAIMLVLEWQAIRTLLDAGAARLGIEAPRSALPSRTETFDLLDQLPEPERQSRAIQFGTSQLLDQHRGMWDLLKARAAARHLSRPTQIAALARI
ncbi:MAG TPA: hypothetical protein VNS79_15345 [Sphingobium sp.]|nr:hypothetical protein [Sphingobium sp.]